MTYTGTPLTGTSLTNIPLPRTECMSLRGALDTLLDAGSHDHGIRDLLVKRGLSGPLGESDRCPVAKFILAETGAVGARVDGYMIEVCYPGRNIASEYTPNVLAEHLDAFDAGHYPELVSEA